MNIGSQVPTCSLVVLIQSILPQAHLLSLMALRLSCAAAISEKEMKPFLC